MKYTAIYYFYLRIILIVATVDAFHQHRCGSSVTPSLKKSGLSNIMDLPSKSFHRNDIKTPLNAIIPSMVSGVSLPSLFAIKRSTAGTTLGKNLLLRGGATIPAIKALATSSSPSILSMILASLLPTCLGYWRTGYTVSYGYGGAMATIATLFLLGSQRGWSVATAHAFALIFYGVRLCSFLLMRELTTSVEIHQMKRRDDSISKRIKSRSPVIFGCSIFYFLVATGPLKITTSLTSSSSFSIVSSILLSLMFFGFIFAAIGDWYKSTIKAKQDDPQNFLVTTGPFKFIRHPNYTGELLGWTSSFFLALYEWIKQQNSSSTVPTTSWGWLLSSAVGWFGMVGLLAGEATGGLERKQKEKYGDTPEYAEWIKSSWSGPMFTSSTSTNTTNATA